MDLARCFFECDTVDESFQPITQAKSLAAVEGWSLFPLTSSEIFASEGLLPCYGDDTALNGRSQPVSGFYPTGRINQDFRHSSQDSQQGAQQYASQYDTDFCSFLYGLNDRSAINDNYPPATDVHVPLTASSCTTSSGRFDFLQHFSSTRSKSASFLTPKEPQLTLMEHYARLKSQQHVKSQLQPAAQAVSPSGCCVAPQPAPATLCLATSSDAGPAKSPCPAPQNCSEPRQNLDQRQLELVSSSMPSTHCMPAPPKDKVRSLDSIFQHPWVASHLQDLTSCFSVGKADEHMTHLLDLNPHSCHSPTKSCDSLTPNSFKSANSVSRYDMQTVQHVPEVGGAKPNIPHPTTTTPLPCTLPMASAYLPSGREAPKSSQQKVSVGHVSPCSPARNRQNSSRPIRQVNARRHLKYSELESPDSEMEPDSPPCKAKGPKHYIAHRLRRRSASQKAETELQLLGTEAERLADVELRLCNRRRKQHNPWTVEETQTLIKGVEDCGGGKWADIKKRKYKSIENRSAVDLKDKWRNLMRLAVLPAAALRTRCAKRRELPLDLLVKVRTLNSMHCKRKAG